MKILILLASLLISFSAFADLQTNIYTGTTGTGKATASGCVYVSFTLSGFTGTIGNAAFSNITLSLPVVSGYQGGAGQRLNPIGYVVTSGTLIVTEVK